jgi:hypothetical protein
MKPASDHRGPKPGRTWLAIAMTIGGVLLVLCCACGGSAGYLGYKLTVPPNLTGRWEEEFSHDILEFRADGTGRLETNGFGTYPFKYHFENFSDMTLRFDPAPENAPLRPGEERWQVSYFHSKMQVEDLNNRGFYRRYRRIN